MMKYDLLKKLKDAGFPQNKHYYCLEDGTISDVCIPTLSELIEACGDRLGGIKRTIEGNQWVAIDDISDYMLPSYKTPEEAVALLYLKLKQYD